ncbi:hypothetical protein GN244_ATG03383 [Phytophthora infestans]|uniref:Uncharacterized protein n=1 Tax=Phytophthora infestans TaxID=4787 RepID=A0A833TIZ2_PHYIN|nr:hypothetical protein GN244_ATG03383 [Phytophthora infestans]KAF4127709.1 hypothetical protein GN958_ATG23075 [Phytophthora infestans]
MHKEEPAAKAIKKLGKGKKKAAAPKAKKTTKAVKKPPSRTPKKTPANQKTPETKEPRKSFAQNAADQDAVEDAAKKKKKANQEKKSKSKIKRKTAVVGCSSLRRSDARWILTKTTTRTVTAAVLMTLTLLEEAR